MNLLIIFWFPDFIQCFPDFSQTKFFKVHKCERRSSLNPRMLLPVSDPKRTSKSSSFLPPDKTYFYSEHFIRIRKGDIESQDVYIRSKSFCCERIIFSNKVNELSKN